VKDKASTAYLVLIMLIVTAQARVNAVFKEALFRALIKAVCETLAYRLCVFVLER
jgi:hypothetical protein